MTEEKSLGQRLTSLPVHRMILPTIAAVLVLMGLVSGGFGMVEIEPGEAGVKYNTVFGDRDGEVITEQGTVMFVPWLQRVEIINIEPLVLVMEGMQDTNDTLVRRLDVRAKDGSNFWFKKLEIHYQADPSQANKIIRVHGTGDAYRQMAVRVHSREILRDEFGLYTFLEAANPSSYGRATAEGKDALNVRLRPTGLEATQVITPKPSFQADVEEAITNRQTAEQEVLVYAKQRERLVKKRDRLRQDVTERKNAEYQTLMATLVADAKKARNAAISVQREADKYAIRRTAKAEAIFTERTNRAAGQAHAARERAKGLAAKVKAVGAAGPGLLDVAIAKRIFPMLQKIKARPYAHAAQPLDIRHIQAGGEVQR